MPTKVTRGPWQVSRIDRNARTIFVIEHYKKGFIGTVQPGRFVDMLASTMRIAGIDVYEASYLARIMLDFVQEEINNVRSTP